MEYTAQQLVDVLKRISELKQQNQYTSKMFVSFLKNLIVLDNDFATSIDTCEQEIRDREEAEKKEWTNGRARLDAKVNAFLTEKASRIDYGNHQIDSLLSQDMAAKKDIFSRLQKCKEVLSLINSVEKSIVSKNEYEHAAKSQESSSAMSLEEILFGSDKLIRLAHEINTAIKDGSKRDMTVKSIQLYGMCRRAETLLNAEISKLRAAIVSNKDTLHNKYENTESDVDKQVVDGWNSTLSGLDIMTEELAAQREQSKAKTKKDRASFLETKQRRIEQKEIEFCKQFPPAEYAAEYDRIYSGEPSYDHYECRKEMPKDIYISTLEYDITALNFREVTTEFLFKNYPFMFKGNKLLIPYCAQFSSEFNYLFKFNGEGRANVVKNACDMGMRLFMMLPPGKVNFTFVDPVTLGESFAMFTRLVDVDDRTSEIINGKIWSSPADIEDKLKIMTNHISNVTQRCLQGKYDNIFEYNKVAEQNSEAYQVIMLMDYPAGLNEQSLKLLEQIATSGPKCGVFTIIYRNESQYKKISERSYPLIKNIEANFTEFHYTTDAKQIICKNEAVKNQKFQWNGIKMPNTQRMNAIIETLKQGIKTADKVVIDIEKVNKIEESKHSENQNTTKNSIRIPIGIHGANEVQYLTLGVGGSHHALIAGLTRSGKSSLLHTIIMRALTQYQSPDELNIYLVDFKRGVEFKTYADYVLPMFKVIAIETEREFAYNILETLENEQKIRADLFKRNHVDKIQEYRELPGYENMMKMPRIVLIMDEFHELFSNSNDEIGKKSAVIMERIVRQGAAFGIHLILSSQSYSNITGLDKAVFDQMAVRIVLKSSKADANLLLDGGSTEIDQISIDDPGRAVYNSEAGNKEYNSHFRVAYIEPDKHREMLETISASTKQFADPQQPTRVLLSNIEDNNYSIFNQFAAMSAADCQVPGRLYIGEPLSVSNDMTMDFTRTKYSNLLMIGGDTEKARNMFAFSILSLCINYKMKYQKAPDKPFIYLFNCKPLNNRYFKDTPKLLAEMLPEYIQYVGCGDTNEIQDIVSQLYDNVSDSAAVLDRDQYFFVFGYQRAEELKSEVQLSQSEDIDSLFNMMSAPTKHSKLSLKDMFRLIVKNGAQKGIHTVIWQDSFHAFYQDDKEMMSYFSMKIAFDMSADEYSRFVSANDVSLMSENNAIYYNRARDNQTFRPYQAPNEDWLKRIHEKLK